MAKRDKPCPERTNCHNELKALTPILGLVNKTHFLLQPLHQTPHHMISGLSRSADYATQPSHITYLGAKPNAIRAFGRCLHYSDRIYNVFRESEIPAPDFRFAIKQFICAFFECKLNIQVGSFRVQQLGSTHQM